MKKSTVYWFVAVFGVVPVFFCISFWILVSGVSSSTPPSMLVDIEFRSIGSAIKTYEISAGRPPATAQGLDVLVHEPSIGPKPRRWTQIMKKLPVDPWRRPYRYALLRPKGREWRWELRSAGRDGIFGNGDDISAEYESGIRIVPGPVRAGENADPRRSF